MPVDPDEYEDQWGSFEFESGGGARQDTEGASFSVEESERYLRGHVLGWGGMGQVWVANDLRLNRDVALKEGSEDGVAQEARITARLEHPGIVPVYDVGRHHGVPFYTMQLNEGGTLANLRRHTVRPADHEGEVPTVRLPVLELVTERDACQ